MKRFLVSLRTFVTKTNVGVGLVLSLAMLLTLLAGLLLAGSNLPVRADEPGLAREIPRHRVGHRAKVQDLDTLLAQDDGGDPLAGNYRLVGEDEIFLALRDSYGTITKWQAYDVDQNLGAPMLINEEYLTGDSPGVATGRFNSDDLDDFAVVWKGDHQAIKMDVGYLRDGLYTVDYVFDTGEQHYAGYSPRVATGDYDGDGQDEIVMAWLGGGTWANLKVYDPQGSIHPSARGKLYDEKVANGNLDVATGDFDGDGNDEVVLAWEDLGNWLGVKVYEVDHNGNLSPKAKWNGSGGRTVAVTTGDFNGDGKDEIAAVDGQYLRILQVAQDLSTLTSKSQSGWGCPSGTDDPSVIPVDVAAGDFNTDGMDEIVSACHTGSGVLVYVWASGSSLGLTQKATWSKSVNYTREGSLAVGDLNRDLRAEIVLAWAQWNDPWYPSQQHNYVQVLQVATDLGSITAKGQGDLGAAPPKTHLAAAVGDLNADSIRVGPPTYSSVVEAKQLLATINEPPKHYDVIDGTTYDVNNNPSTYASYENSQRQSTEMSLTTTRDWGISTGLEAEAWGINASLKTSYGESFENTTSSFKEMAFGQNAWASSDDVIMRTETDYDVWEYPVYSDTIGTLQGHIAVVFPRKRDPNCTSNCEASVIARIDGRNPLSYYAPNHQNANLLSYSKDPPGDIGTNIKSASRNYVGSNPYEFWVEWTDVESDEAKKSRQLDVSIGVGVEHWGIKADVEGTYSKGEVSTQKVSFEQTTSIHIYFDAINPTYSYRVDPYIYWSSDDGHLVVDYAAQPLTASPPTWWQNTYNKPDPTFNLPWKYNPPSEDYRLLSKEITFAPASPTAGGTVTVTARVRNYSLVGAYNVKVRFYLGDPDAGGVPIGSDQLIPQLNPLSSQTVHVQFDTSGWGGQTLNIYALIDPEDNIEEMHEDNNKAYAQLPVKSGRVSVGPVTLAITAENIAFVPEVPVQNATVDISATIQALGADFTWVAVEFWDGDPRGGGQLIGGELIPMILRGETATAHIAWDTTGKRGAHDIWVGVDHRARDEDLYADNWAHRTIHLAPVRLYLPLLRKDS